MNKERLHKVCRDMILAARLDCRKSVEIFCDDDTTARILLSEHDILICQQFEALVKFSQFAGIFEHNGRIGISVSSML